MTTIAVISCQYRETTLGSLFSDHYSFADYLTIIDANQNAEFSDNEKRDTINAIIAESRADWLIVVDADEFVFHPANHLREILEMSPYDVYPVPFFTVYRHASEGPINSEPVLAQRCHGDPVAGRCYGHYFIKPIIVRANIKPQFSCGQHKFSSSRIPQYAPAPLFFGAHWCMADADLAIQRRIRDRKERLSALNYAMRYGVQNFDITEQQIRDECEAHRNDPQLWEYQVDGTVRMMV